MNASISRTINSLSLPPSPSNQYIEKIKLVTIIIIVISGTVFDMYLAPHTCELFLLFHKCLPRLSRCQPCAVFCEMALVGGPQDTGGAQGTLPT